LPLLKSRTPEIAALIVPWALDQQVVRQLRVADCGVRRDPHRAAGYDTRSGPAPTLRSLPESRCSRLVRRAVAEAEMPLPASGFITSAMRSGTSGCCVAAAYARPSASRRRKSAAAIHPARVPATRSRCTNDHRRFVPRNGGRIEPAATRAGSGRAGARPIFRPPHPRPRRSSRWSMNTRDVMNPEPSRRHPRLSQRQTVHPSVTRTIPAPDETRCTVSCSSRRHGPEVGMRSPRVGCQYVYPSAARNTFHDILFIPAPPATRWHALAIHWPPFRLSQRHT
jgi:hypothetical protein